MHGRPVADIVPRRTRSERRPSEHLLTDLHEISLLAAELAARTRGRQAGAMDAIIAATAHGITVWTQDADFAVLSDLATDLLIHRS